MSNNIQEITDREFMDTFDDVVKEVGQVQFEAVVPIHGALQESDLREVMASVNSQPIVSRSYQPIYDPIRMYEEASKKLDLKIKKIEEDRIEEEAREASRPAFDYEIF